MNNPALSFLSNYNCSLYHAVEKATRWDAFVSPTWSEYFHNNYDLNDTDKGFIEDLRRLRADLTWRAEADLHKWAYNGFPEDERYQALLPAIQHFETKIDNHGKTLGDYLSDTQPEIDLIRDKLHKQFISLNISSMMEKMQKLVGFTSDLDQLPAFFVPTPSPHSTQGGANGPGITIEVHPQIQHLKHSLALIVHEYAHAVIDPSHYFATLASQEVIAYFAHRDSTLWGDGYADYLEELIIRAAINVYVFHQDPLREAAVYNSRGTKRLDMYELSWENTALIAPIITSYLDDQLSEEETRQELITTFKEKIEKGRRVI